MAQTFNEDITINGNLTVTGLTSVANIEASQDIDAVNVNASGDIEAGYGGVDGDVIASGPVAAPNILQWATKQVPWDPGSIADEASVLYDLPWPEAEAGDFVLTSFTGLGDHVRWLLGAHIPQSGGKVIVRLRNDTGNAFNPAAGVLNVLLVKWPGVQSWLS